MQCLAMYTAISLSFSDYLPRNEITTFFKFLPDQLIYSELFLRILRILVFTSSLFWAFNLLLPASSIVSALSFFTLVSLSAERTPYTNHQWHFLAVGLILFSVWYWNSYKAILSARRVLFFGRKAEFPLWIPQALLIFCSVGYFYSGLTKLYYSGWHWMNGLSLQMWTYVYSSHESFLRSWILSSRNIAATFQLLALISELSAILLIFSRTLRIPIGIMLIFFHLGNEVLFHFGFYGNILVCAFAFLLNPLPAPVCLEFRLNNYRQFYR